MIGYIFFGMLLILLGALLIAFTENGPLLLIAALLVVAGVTFTVSGIIDSANSERNCNNRKGHHWVSESQIIQIDGLHLVGDEGGTCFRVVT